MHSELCELHFAYLHAARQARQLCDLRHCLVCVGSRLYSRLTCSFSFDLNEGTAQSPLYLHAQITFPWHSEKVLVAPLRGIPLKPVTAGSPQYGCGYQKRPFGGMTKGDLCAVRALAGLATRRSPSRAVKRPVLHKESQTE